MNQFATIRSGQPLVQAPSIQASGVRSIWSTAGTSPQWNAVLARFNAAAAKAAAFYRTNYEPILNAQAQRQREQEAELQRQIDAIPHYTTTRSYESAEGPQVNMTTANASHVRAALDSWALKGTDDFVECCRELFKAISKRFAQEHEIRECFVFSPSADIPSDIKAKYNRLGKASGSAFRAVLEFQARSAADLIAKVQFLKEQDCDVDHDDLLADLFRLVGEA